MSAGIQGRRPQSQLQGWQELKCSELMGHWAFFAKQPATKQGWCFLFGGTWRVLRVWQFCGGEFKEQVRIGYFWRKVQLFLDQQPLVVGHQVRLRQQLQQVPPEGWWSHVPQQVRGASYFWKQVRLASPLIKVALWVLPAASHYLCPGSPPSGTGRGIHCPVSQPFGSWVEVNLDWKQPSDEQSRQHQLELFNSSCWEKMLQTLPFICKFSCFLCN